MKSNEYKVEKYTGNKKSEEFSGSILLQNSVIHRIEIIVETLKNILEEIIKEKDLEIPWKQIGNMQDIFIHEYFGIDLELSWVDSKKEKIRTKKKLEQMDVVSRFVIFVIIRIVRCYHTKMSPCSMLFSNPLLEFKLQISGESS